MNTRWLRARLDRLDKKIPKPFVDDSGVTIDPTLAKALRDDEVRLDELSRKRGDGVAESEEELMLRARIVDQATAIGRTLAAIEPLTKKAHHRLDDLRSKRRSGTLSAAGDAEEAQLVAREAAYRESPEARGLARVYELSLNKICGELTAAEQSEYQELEKRFPCPTSLPDDDPYKDVYDKIYGADALEKPDRLDQVDQNLLEEESVTQDKRASHAADRATRDALDFWWRFGKEAVVALLSMRDIDETLERMQQEVDDPGFLERKIGYVPRIHPDGSLATITRLRGRTK